MGENNLIDTYHVIRCIDGYNYAYTEDYIKRNFNIVQFSLNLEKDNENFLMEFKDGRKFYIDKELFDILVGW